MFAIRKAVPRMNSRENGKIRTNAASTMLSVGSIVALGLTFSTVTTSISGLVMANASATAANAAAAAVTPSVAPTAGATPSTTTSKPAVKSGAATAAKTTTTKKAAPAPKPAAPATHAKTSGS